MFKTHQTALLTKKSSFCFAVSGGATVKVTCIHINVLCSNWKVIFLDSKIQNKRVTSGSINEHFTAAPRRHSIVRVDRQGCVNSEGNCVVGSVVLLASCCSLHGLRVRNNMI